MTEEQRVLISAAEPSGDLHAAGLVREIARRRPGIRFEGFGGARLREEGCRIHEDLVALASMGLGFRKHIGRYYGVLRTFQKLIEEARPSAVVLVDSPGLNFALARLARWRGVPVVYYICPQVWAWAPWRRAKVLRYTNQLIVILPFEEELYRNPRVPVRYVGHPLADSLVEAPSDAGAVLRDQLGIPQEDRLIALLPGSREHEVRELAPLFGGILREMGVPPAGHHVVASSCRPHFRGLIGDSLDPCPFPVHISDADSRSIMQAADFVLVASGTASLEVAYFGKPMIVTYSAGRLSQFIFGLLTVTPFFSLPNILGAHLFDGEPVVPERLCKGDEAGELAREAVSLLEPGPGREAALSRLVRLKEQVFQPGATARAADALLEFLDRGMSPGGDSPKG